MWIEDADNYGKIVTWGTTGGLETILEEAIRYGKNNDWSIDGIDTHMGNTYEDILVTVTYKEA